jgi:hypothetical protein
MDPLLWETEEYSAYFGKWKPFHFHESNLRYSSHSENIEFLRTDFQDRFQELRRCEI